MSNSVSDSDIKTHVAVLRKQKEKAELKAELERLERKKTGGFVGKRNQMGSNKHTCQLSLECSKCVWDPDVYSALSQHKSTVYLTQVNNVFRQKSVTYLTNLDKVLFAANYLAGTIRNEWKLEDKQIIADLMCNHTYTRFCEFLQEWIKLAHIRQVETIVQISNKRQQSNQSVQNLIAALGKLEEQQDLLFLNNQRMMNLFLALDRKLWNELVRFEKPCAMREELKALTINLEKTLASTETLLQLWQDGTYCQGVLSSKKGKRQPQKFGKRQQPVSGTLSPLAMVDTEINHPTKLDLSTAGGVPLPRSATPSAQGIDKLQGLNTIWESQLEAPELTLNVHQVVNGLRQKDRPYHHLFHDFTAYVNLEVFQVQTMIDSGITWNLIL